MVLYLPQSEANEVLDGKIHDTPGSRVFVTAGD